MIDWSMHPCCELVVRHGVARLKHSSAAGPARAGTLYYRHFATVRSTNLGRHGRTKCVGLGLASCNATPQGKRDDDNECNQRHCGIELRAEADAMRPDPHGE